MLKPWPPMIRLMASSSHYQSWYRQAFLCFSLEHYNDVIISAMASQITSLTIVYSTVYSGNDERKTSKLRVTGPCVGNSPVNSPHKEPITRKMFPFDDVILGGFQLPVLPRFRQIIENENILFYSSNVVSISKCTEEGPNMFMNKNPNNPASTAKIFNKLKSLTIKIPRAFAGSHLPYWVIYCVQSETNILSSSSMETNPKSLVVKSNFEENMSSFVVSLPAVKSQSIGRHSENKAWVQQMC